MPQDFDFDFSLFEDVPPPKSHAAVYRLTLAVGDRLCQNDLFTALSRGPRPSTFNSVPTAVSSAWIPRAPTT